MNRYSALVLAACVTIGFAVPAQASAAGSLSTAPAADTVRSVSSALPSKSKQSAPTREDRQGSQRPGRSSSTTLRTPTTLTPDGTWVWQNPLPDGNTLLSVSCPSTTICYATNTIGQVLRTSNDGDSWTVQSTGVSTSLNGISCPTVTNCVAVGDYGVALQTSTSGASWSKQTINSGNFLAGVSCPDSFKCVAVGYAGSVMLTANGGTNWVGGASSTGYNLYGVSCSSDLICVAVGANGSVQSTTNGGGSWTLRLPAIVAVDLEGVSCWAGNCVTVGLAGNIGYLIGGYGWFTTTTPDGNDLWGVSCTSVHNCWLVGSAGTAGVLTWDIQAPGESRTWTPTASQTSRDLIGVSCASVQTCVAVGDSGVTVKTPLPASLGWQPQVEGVASNLYGISCPGAISLCFAVGADGAIAKSTDQGRSWTAQHSLVQSDLRGISCPSSLVCVAVGLSGKVITTKNAGVAWNSRQHSGASLHLYGVSCPTTSNCWAVGGGGLVLATSDGGLTWSAQASSTVQRLLGISCASTSVCMAVGDSQTIVGTTDGGANWSPKPATGSFLFGSLTSISCPSTLVCYAVSPSNPALKTIDGGANWTLQGLNINASWSGVSCSSINECAAVGSGSASTTVDGGSFWTARASGTGLSDAQGVSCPTADCIAVAIDAVAVQFVSGTWSIRSSQVLGVSCATTSACMAVGASGLVLTTVDGGSNWTHRSIGDFTDLYGVSCPTALACYVSGRGLVGVTLDGGANWTTSGLGGGEPMYGISCGSSSACVAVGYAGTVGYTTNSGTNWTFLSTSASPNSFFGVSCPSTLVCFGSTDIGVWKTGDGGSNWSLSKATSNILRAISCSSTSVCAAVGGGGLILTTPDGGANWTVRAASGYINDLRGVSCIGTQNCMVAGSAGLVLVTSDAGSTWGAQFAGPVSNLRAISCNTADACHAVGDHGTILVTTTHGSAPWWTLTRPTGNTNNLRGISCPNTQTCFAVGYPGTFLHTINGGATWVDDSLDTTDELYAISCPSLTRCYAVGWPGRIYVHDIGGWALSAGTNPVSGLDVVLFGVSCWGLNACTAVGTGGTILKTSDGTNWTAQASGTPYDLYAVSCPSSSRCVAVGDHGVVRVRGAGAWTAGSSGTVNNFRGVTCPTTSLCYAVGWFGTLRRSINGGGTWAAQNSGLSVALYGVSCVRTTICLAPGNFGRMTMTVNGTSWTPLLSPTANWFRAVSFPDLNHAWVAGLGGTIIANNSLISSCTSVSITAAPTSPQPRGTMVGLTAASAGCPHANPLYRFYLRSPSAVWSIVQDFGTSNTFLWNTTTYVPGTYLIGVWVRDAGSGFTYDAYAFGTFTMAAAPCTSANLSSDVPSPQQSGTTVNFTASSISGVSGVHSFGCPLPLFQWWVRNSAGVWSIAVPYSSVDTFAWNTTGLTDSTYQIGIWAKEKGSTRSYEAYAFVTYTLTPLPITGTTHCQAANVDASPTSPQPKDGSVPVVTLTATVFGCDTPEYKWWVRNTSAVWAVVQDYPGTATFDFLTASRPAGTYLLGVWVRQAGSTAAYEAYSFITYTLTVPPPEICTSVNLSPNFASPQAPGATITFTAAALGCNTPTYKFWVLPPGGTWTVVQAYGASNTFAWNTNGLSPGPWQIGVWARQSGSTSSYQAFAFITFQLTFG